MHQNTEVNYLDSSVLPDNSVFASEEATTTATKVPETDSWLSSELIDGLLNGIQKGFNLVTDVGEIQELKKQLTNNTSVAGGKLAPRERVQLERKAGELFISVYDLELVECIQASPTDSGGYTIHIPSDAREAFQQAFQRPVGLENGKVHCYVTIKDVADGKGSVAFFGTNSTTLMKMQEFITTYTGDNPIGWEYRG